MSIFRNIIKSSLCFFFFLVGALSEHTEDKEPFPYVTTVTCDSEQTTCMGVWVSENTIMLNRQCFEQTNCTNADTEVVIIGNNSVSSIVGFDLKLKDIAFLKLIRKAPNNETAKSLNVAEYYIENVDKLEDCYYTYMDHNNYIVEYLNPENGSLLKG